MSAGEFVAIGGGPYGDLAGAFAGGVLQVVDVHRKKVDEKIRNSKFEIRKVGFVGGGDQGLDGRKGT